MKLMIIIALAAAVLAAPCIYDVSSQEPSPLMGLVAAASAIDATNVVFAPSRH